MSQHSSSVGKNDFAAFVFTVGIKLFVICLVVAILLGVVNQMTAEPIRLLAVEADNAALTGAVPEADSFTDVEGYVPEGIIKRFYVAQSGGEQIGYCVKVAPKGFGGDIVMMVGLDMDARVTGISLVSMAETPGVGTRTKDTEFLSQFIGKNAVSIVKKTPSGESEVEAVSGATISSKAVAAGVQAAIDLVKITEGGN